MLQMASGWGVWGQDDKDLRYVRRGEREQGPLVIAVLSASSALR